MLAKQCLAASRDKQLNFLKFINQILCSLHSFVNVYLGKTPISSTSSEFKFAFCVSVETSSRSTFCRSAGSYINCRLTQFLY